MTIQIPFGEQFNFRFREFSPKNRVRETVQFHLSGRDGRSKYDLPARPDQETPLAMPIDVSPRKKSVVLSPMI